MSLYLMHCFFFFGKKVFNALLDQLHEGQFQDKKPHISMGKINPKRTEGDLILPKRSVGWGAKVLVGNS